MLRSASGRPGYVPMTWFFRNCIDSIHVDGEKKGLIRPQVPLFTTQSLFRIVPRKYTSQKSAKTAVKVPNWAGPYYPTGTVRTYEKIIYHFLICMTKLVTKISSWIFIYLARISTANTQRGRVMSTSIGLFYKVKEITTGDELFEIFHCKISNKNAFTKGLTKQKCLGPTRTLIQPCY